MGIQNLQDWFFIANMPEYFRSPDLTANRAFEGLGGIAIIINNIQEMILAGLIIWPRNRRSCIISCRKISRDEVR